VVAGEIGGAPVRAHNGASIAVPLAAGAHAIRLHLASAGERWRLVPLWDGVDAWSAVRFTTALPSSLDRAVSRPIAAATTTIVLLMVTAWSASFLARHRVLAPALGWSAAAAGLFIVFGTAGWFERFAALLLAASLLVPVPNRQQNVRAAFVLIGIPWLVLFVARSWGQVGHSTIYSAGDDWQMFQVAAYR